ncbi:hypothetical protein V2I01_10685 [Micromonospora sp. BRA006-A]|nr:hypothetical protein [Micromonospora sp. BRA006-A]
MPPHIGVDVGRELEERTGKVAVMYASRGQYGDDDLGDFPRWNADYPYRVAEDFKAAYARAGGTPGRAGRATASWRRRRASGSSPIRRSSAASTPVTRTRSAAPLTTSRR